MLIMYYILAGVLSISRDSLLDFLERAFLKF